ncbi:MULTISPECIES: acyl carrier protein [Congzhengia]|uniref:Acyl carrier protein n=1 Tax=Congzhengia minquanensis TaxID=2763657 RepID=A0A926DLY4_9FIRM|nr:acyl carrier protein [Congzhengia minquanensis]MBC8540433.1 acyl carrier protein [Congzhengia minquanensis]MBD8946912.1 acyl carrier protein [Clostridiales bacterium]HBL81302.1 acyl carrier protein [Clostridiales bacterium]
MTKERVIELLAEHLDVDASTITEATTFEDLDIDSLDTVEIMMEMEDEFGIEIKVEDIGKTVGELIAHIDANKE